MLFQGVKAGTLKLKPEAEDALRKRHGNYWPPNTLRKRPQEQEEVDGDFFRSYRLEGRSREAIEYKQWLFQMEHPEVRSKQKLALDYVNAGEILHRFAGEKVQQ